MHPRNICIESVDPGQTFLFGCVAFLGFQSHPAAHQGVILVAVCTVVAAAAENTVQMRAFGDNKVQLVPMLGSGMSPRYFVAKLRLEEGICYAESMVGADFKQSLSVVIQLSNTKMSKANWP